VNRWRTLLILAVLLVAGSLTAFLWTRDRQPQYEGRNLLHWLELYELGAGNREATEQAARAVRQIGTNAVPWLVKWMKYERPYWRAEVVQMLGNKWYQRARQHARLADRGFAILGPTANCALPELDRMTHNTAQPATALAALAVVRRFADGAPVLAGVITDRTARLDFRLQALAALENGVVEGQIPRTNEYTRLAVRETATWLTDPNPTIRECATNALERIAPEVLTNATSAQETRK